MNLCKWLMPSIADTSSLKAPGLSKKCKTADDLKRHTIACAGVIWAEMSPAMISTITEKVVDFATEWQSSPLHRAATLDLAEHNFERLQQK